ncbi:glycosyltransferase [Pseudanabaenaceae cyanobacterium LEGE 13415]|nr:glycosyltransferase [Pseudanabaenaceae cyanobacterium LEGE 13415]
MRVLHAIGGLEQRTGGTARIAVNLCEALVRQGIEPSLIATVIERSGAELVDFSTIANRVHLFERKNIERFTFSLPLRRWLTQNIRNYDLVHIHGLFSYSGYTSAAIARQASIPYVIAPHGMLEPWAFAHKPRRKALGFRLVEQKNLTHAAAINATSSPEVQSIAARCSHDRIRFIPNGISSSMFEQCFEPEQFYKQFPHTQGKELLLFLGRIDPKKGLDLLAPAFAQLNHSFPNTHLVVAGPDGIGFLNKAKQFFIDAGCFEQVTFTGNLSGSLKQSALAAATAYIAPSYSEGFSVSVLEGMAAGLPCIITTGCNFPEASNVAYVTDIDVNAVANALIDCFSDRLAAKTLGQRARQFILDRYTWDQVAAQMIELYQEILSRSSLRVLV